MKTIIMPIYNLILVITVTLLYQKNALFRKMLILKMYKLHQLQINIILRELACTIIFNP